MSAATEKPVVVNASITAAVSSVIPAVTLFMAAFTSWEPTAEQTNALSALTIAVIGVATAFLSKNAAGKVFVPSSVAPLVEAGRVEGAAAVEADANQRVAHAESFGVPDQNQMPYPVRPAGGAPPP